MFELSIQGDIAAAHYVRGHQGKCENLHGHTWKIEVAVTGERLNGIGMVEDFAVLKMKLKEFLAALEGITDPEKKREAITQTFYRHVFGRIVKESGAKSLLQGFTHSLISMAKMILMAWQDVEAIGDREHQYISMRSPSMR